MAEEWVMPPALMIEPQRGDPYFCLGFQPQIWKLKQCPQTIGNARASNLPRIKIHGRRMGRASGTHD